MRLLLFFALLAPGCGDDEDTRPPGVLDLGVRVDETFEPLAEGATMAVILGPNGLNMVVPSLRSAQIDPRAPDPTVSVTVGGILMAADIEGARVDMEDDGTGNVLWDLRVPFQTELCCYICEEGLMKAKIRDATGRRFEGQVTIRLERGGCPDTAACCGDPNTCPDPSLTQLCE
ncbi:MAG: hypothetical protein HYY06_07790 [Deltaproteobacteria bacterium]|nr:hypothetical protein [Deltaproteobacteria bacterium]